MYVPVGSYHYAETPLTSAAVAFLISELFAGKPPVKRIDIARAVTHEHVARGGAPGVADPLTQVKKVLADMQAAGTAVSVGSGYWRIPGERPAPAAMPEMREIGQGNEHVYVYYYPSDWARAQEAGEARWRCKVGRTVGPVPSRIAAQGTGMPERGRVGLDIRTPNSRQLEVVLHGILVMRNRRVSDAPGTEWFLTSPTEIEEIYGTIGG
jgi:hypothetical protein